MRSTPAAAPMLGQRHLRQLGYGDTATIGDDETANSRHSRDLGSGAATGCRWSPGFGHTALLDDGTDAVLGLWRLRRRLARQHGHRKRR